MPDPTPRLYEGLFLLNQQLIAGDLATALATVRQMIERFEGEVVALRRWDERRLAYQIEGQKRGTYLLAHFRITPSQIVNIERDCNLSDEVMRVLFTRLDHFGETELEAVIKDAESAEAEAALRSAAVKNDDTAGDEQASTKSSEADEPSESVESAKAQPVESDETQDAAADSDEAKEKPASEPTQA